MVAYIRIIRPINLLIILITQWIIYYLVIVPQLVNAGHTPTLSPILFILFALVTISLAAGAYLINDIMDYQADFINKPQQLFIPHKIPKSHAYIYYALVNLAGFFIAFLIAVKTDRLTLLWIHPLATFILYLYSKSLKHIQVIGNIVVAMFTAFVPGILWYTEIDNLKTDNSDVLNFLLLSYVIFAFYSNFIREGVKDIEDMEGDKNAGSKTLPIVIGLQKTKIFLFFHQVVFTFLLLLFLIKAHSIFHTYLPLMVSILLLLPGSLNIGKSIYHLKEPRQAKKISKELKYLMLAGLMVFVLFAYA